VMRDGKDEINALVQDSLRKEEHMKGEVEQDGTLVMRTACGHLTHHPTEYMYFREAQINGVDIR
jgi:hypothetical protein